MVSATLFRLYTRTHEKNLYLDPVVEGLCNAIDNFDFRFNNASRDETYGELLSRLSYRIDLICTEAQNPTGEEQYQEIYDEVYSLVKTYIQGLSEEEKELDHIPF